MIVLDRIRGRGTHLQDFSETCARFDLDCRGMEYTQIRHQLRKQQIESAAKQEDLDSVFQSRYGRYLQVRQLVVVIVPRYVM